MRLYEIEGKRRLFQRNGKLFIDDLEVPAGEAIKIKRHIDNLLATVNRFDVTKRINDYINAAYDVIKDPYNAEYLDIDEPVAAAQ